MSSPSDKDLLKIVKLVRRQAGLRLVGQCNRCGKCCEGLVKRYSIYADTVVFKGYGDKHCEAYDAEKKICRDYRKRRPLICRLWPITPDLIMEGCGFKFVHQRKGGSVE